MTEFSGAMMKPLVVIKSLIDENGDMLKNLDQVGEYMKTIVKEDINKIPCINEVSIDQIPPNSLVRFRGMVQDMLDPEFYLGKYSSINKTTNEKVVRYGCYTDTGVEQVSEEFNFNADGNVTLERQTFYCVPIPGEGKWIKDLYTKNNNSAVINVSHEERVSKRKLNDNQSETVEMETERPDEKVSVVSQNDEKRLKNTGNVQTDDGEKGQTKKAQAKIDYAKNFPLPNEKGSATFVKMYSKTTELKLNEVAEFVCVLSVDPQFASSTMLNEMEHDEMVTWHDSNMVEDEAQCPPPSLVPRLHCLFFDKLEELNPHVRLRDSEYESASKELTSIRADLIQLLKQLLGGDGLAAEYLLLHLISRVYGRVDTMCIGKLSLNLLKCPNSAFIQKLYSFFNMILPKSFYLPMTLDNLNNKKFVPSKDFEANRLRSGILQLSNDTNLVLDETRMEPGKLDSDGVRNITALGNLIQWQKLEYDFKFNRLDIETNVNVLVLSEGKSLLKCDCQVPLCYEDIGNQVNLDNLSSKLVEKFQIYLSIVRSMKYELTEEVQKALEDDFVEMRKEDSNSMNADAFYLLLTTARYMALSHGQDTLSAPLWVRVKELDCELRKRLRT